MDKVLEAKRNGLLKSGSNIFKAKWHNPIWKCSLGGCESSLVLLLFSDLNLVITEKPSMKEKTSWQA